MKSNDIKSVFFERKSAPKSFLETSGVIVNYLKMIVESSLVDFDSILMFPKENEYKIESLDDLYDEKTRIEIAECLLRLKLDDIKKYHKNVKPDLNFKESVGNSFFLKIFKKNEKRLSYIFYLGGDKETVFIEGFKNINLSANNLRALFEKHCIFLEPLYGFFYSSFIKKQQQLPEYFFGWMNYFSNEINLPPIPPEYEIEQIANLGKLLITTREDFDAVNNPVHYQKAMKLVELFRHYNCMRPQ